MVTYKCNNCGGELNFSDSGGFDCPYCGSKSFMSDSDYKENEEFRKKLLQIYKTEAKNKELDYSSDTFWSCAGTDYFTVNNGQTLQIEYMKKYEYYDFICYIAKESVVYIFRSTSEAEDYLNGLNRMVFPPADSRLHRSFPKLKMQLKLEDDKTALVFLRRPNFYPVKMFAPWESEHLAWVISRMENICCALNYAGIEHRDISPDSVWINPISHEGALFGDWRNVRQLKSSKDLNDLRKVAKILAKDARNPQELNEFLNSKPEADAFSDFEKWDKVIVDGFGGHRFIKM